MPPLQWGVDHQHRAVSDDGTLAALLDPPVEEDDLVEIRDHDLVRATATATVVNNEFGNRCVRVSTEIGAPGRRPPSSCRT
ncbi:hypothetical protein OEB99_05170 [Actinotalea sp. M2MS4P-6]|uniref:hypothetical protein n=1 Tax=Actinotalea sp. M2MS4P-6 TaxID=2983762 RepID=UPI0021E51027|nr:hypothetical protein [Actinotalea sp. M2MS4P-6]MCV2393693.1 hypothetical protein [Actinotalea sp. M2MS4P-6]